VHPKNSYVRPRAAALIPSVTEFIEWLAGVHRCGCGAKYSVTASRVPTASVVCEKCGTLMDTPANQSSLAYVRIPEDK
jgi:hypothetical protein